VMNGKSLLELSLEDDDHIDLGFWLDFDNKMDAVLPMIRLSKNYSHQVYNLQA
jgi:hypothetical protein